MTPVDAVTPVDSATTFDSQDTGTWSAEQKQEWTDTGKVTPPSSQDSAPAKKSAVADPAPQKPAVASDSATEKDSQKPHLKTEEDSENRFRKLASENKTLKERLEALERRSPEQRDTKQVSQPAPEEYKRLDIEEWKKTNPNGSYEDFVDAAAEHKAKWLLNQELPKALGAERQRIAQEAAAKELKVKVEEGKARYEDFEEKLWPTLRTITEDPQIPSAVKAMLNDSDVLVDLVYVLGSESGELATFLQLAKSNPGQAIRKLVATESLVREQLKANVKPATETPRGDDGKFTKPKEEKEEKEAPEPKPRVTPKTPPEVGGRGAAPDDAAKVAARSGNFSAFEAEQNRRARASLT